MATMDAIIVAYDDDDMRYHTQVVNWIVEQRVTRLVILTSSIPVKSENGSFYFPPGQYPKDVDFLGVRKQVISAMKAGVQHILLCSSMGTTDPDNFLNKHLENVLFYKLNGEALLQSSGLPFTIVKPGGLLGEDMPA
eukprot:8872183-Pyramimonas_sp.AAC.1